MIIFKGGEGKMTANNVIVTFVETSSSGVYSVPDASHTELMQIMTRS